jgi:FKBP-type peptidyl-prolyl cis-trans isomerase 2
MKKYILYSLVFLLFTSFSCQFSSGVKPKMGDAVLYDYTVKEGDAVVFKSALQMGDTATMIIEDMNINDPLKKTLVEQVRKMSVNDSLSFDLPNHQKGYLRLYRIISASDFPKYIEEGDRKARAFEQQVMEVGKELRATVPLYQSRRNAVIDSAKNIFDQYQKGQLENKLNILNTDNKYFVVKGKDKNADNRKKWVWFHYITYGLDGKTLIDSYKNLPRGTNVAEFTFNEALERSIANFEEGSIVFFSVPSEFQDAPKTGDSNAILKKKGYWIEIVKVLHH